MEIDSFLSWYGMTMGKSPLLKESETSPVRHRRAEVDPSLVRLSSFRQTVESHLTLDSLHSAALDYSRGGEVD